MPEITAVAEAFQAWVRPRIWCCKDFYIRGQAVRPCWPCLFTGWKPMLPIVTKIRTILFLVMKKSEIRDCPDFWVNKNGTVPFTATIDLVESAMYAAEELAHVIEWIVMENG
jgi:hypothetical protein